MACFQYEETDYLYQGGTGVEGPTLKDFDNQTLCYDGGAWTSKRLFCLLNALCKNVAVYSVTAEGSSVSDCYSGEEHTYDPVTGKHFQREFNYCYGDGTAFDEYVESEYEDLSEAGTRCEEQTIDVNDFSGIFDSFDLLEKSLGYAEEGNFSELHDVIAKKKKELADSGKTYTKINDNVLERAMTFGEEFIISGSVKRIGYGAFDNCKTLSRIIIPEGVESIGSNAFSGCSKLVEVTLPAGVKEISECAFIDCDDLTITAPVGSYAIKYADECGIKYIETEADDYNEDDE